MEIRRRATMATTVLGLAAIGVVASIYTRGGGTRFGSTPGSPSRGGVPDQTGLPGWAIENFFTILLSLAVLFIVVVGGYLLVVRRLDGLGLIARYLALAVVVAIGTATAYFGPIALLLYLFPIDTPEMESPEGVGGLIGTGEGGNPGAAVTGETATAAFIAIAVLCFVGLFLYFILQRDNLPTMVGGGSGANEEQPVPEGSGDVSTAIDIEDVPTTNAVYRAWRAMATSAVDGSDRTVSASEVARAADRSGFDREAVYGLTDLFEEVRYGDKPVTDERERRAREFATRLDIDGEGTNV